MDRDNNGKQTKMEKSQLIKTEVRINAADKNSKHFSS